VTFHTGTFIDAIKETVLQAKRKQKKNKHRFALSSLNAGKNCDIKIGYRRFENVTHYKYLRMNLLNENLIEVED
jgi:hypothetical protein